MWANLCGFLTSRLVQLTIFQRTKSGIDHTSDSHSRKLFDRYSFRLFTRSHSISRSPVRRWACLCRPVTLRDGLRCKERIFGALMATWLRRFCSQSLASALALKSCPDICLKVDAEWSLWKRILWCGRCGFPPFAKRRRMGHPRHGWVAKEPERWPYPRDVPQRWYLIPCAPNSLVIFSKPFSTRKPSKELVETFFVVRR